MEARDDRRWAKASCFASRGGTVRLNYEDEYLIAEFRDADILKQSMQFVLNTLYDLYARSHSVLADQGGEDIAVFTGYRVRGKDSEAWVPESRDRVEAFDHGGTMIRAI